MSRKIIELHRSDIPRVARKPKQRGHALNDQTASIEDHVELHIASDQHQMEGPDDGRGTQRHKEQTA